MQTNLRRGCCWLATWGLILGNLLQGLPAAAQPAKLRFALDGGQSASSALAYTPDGEKLVSYGRSGAADKAGPATIQVWDVTSGQCTARFQAGAEGFRALAVTDQTVITAGAGYDENDSYGGVVRYWDLKTGKLLENFKTKLDGNSYIARAILSRDGQTLAMQGHAGFGDAGAVLVVDLKAKKTLFKVEKGGQNNLAFSPDGKVVAVGPQLYKVPGGEKLLRLPFETSSNLAFSPDGKLLAVNYDRLLFGKFGGKHILWDLATQKEKWAVNYKSDFEVPLTFSPDGKLLYNHHILIETETGKQLAVLKHGSPQAGNCCFSPDSKTLALNYSDEGISRPIILWDIAAKKTVGRLPKQDFPHSIQCLGFSPDNQELIVGSRQSHSDSLVFRWQASSGKLLGTTKLTGWIWPVAIHPNGQAAAAAEDAGGQSWAMKLVNLDTKKEMANWPAGNKGFGGYDAWAAFSADGKRLVWGAPFATQKGGEAKTVDLTTKLVIGTLPDADRGVLSPDGKAVALFGHNHNKIIVRSVAGAELAVLQTNADGVHCAAFSSDGGTVAFAEQLQKEKVKVGDIKLWDWQNKKLLGTLAVPERRIAALAFSPKHKLLAAAAIAPRNFGTEPMQPHQLQLWDLATKQPLATLEIPVGTWDGMRLAFSADESLLALGDSAGGIRVWEISLDGKKEK